MEVCSQWVFYPLATIPKIILLYIHPIVIVIVETQFG